MEQQGQPPRLVVLIPCLNEERTIAEVVTDFRTALPSVEVYVCDNGSTDRTVLRAEGAGARVLQEPRRGKGYVMQSMFRQVEADIYLIVDGDGTYTSDAVRSLIDPVVCGHADMVIGSRLHPAGSEGFSRSHLWGNYFFVLLSRALFGIGTLDILSGYRVLSRAVVDKVNLTSGGFQVETELTIKAIREGFRVIDVPVVLKPRPPGSHSKIRILRDGWAILVEMLALRRS